MIYSVRQLTRYRYVHPVPFGWHMLRLTPISDATQTVRTSRIDIDPEPVERTDTDDFFGNRVTFLSIEAPHRVLEVRSEAIVAHQPRVEIDPSATPPWVAVCEEAAKFADLGGRSPVHHLFPSRLVPIEADIGAYAADSFTPGRPVLEAGVELMNRIHEDFDYDPDVTDVTTPPREVFWLRRGVCQDFAHLMICGLRAIGLPAAYVSGYIRTVPRAGQPRLEGADATHAWVALWCGAEAGWQGLDPTNAIRVGADHITLAMGRDYTDVSPVDGVIHGSGGQVLSVAVDVAPID